MSTSLTERMAAAWRGWRGDAAKAEAPATDAERELARLRLDAQAKDGEIARLREEYARREARAKEEAAAAGREALAALVGRVAAPLSQLVTLRHLAESGREVRAADVLKLLGKIEEALREQGLEAVGAPGEVAAFDPAWHQRMSGGDVRDGDRVRVRFPGYRFGGATPLKALVSREKGDGVESGKWESGE